MNRRFFWLLAGCQALSWPLAAQTDTAKQLSEVTITHREKATEINTIPTIKNERIGAKELLKAACCNLSESFETTPSVDVAYTDAVTGYKQIQMLGLTGPYTYFTRENIPDIRGLAAITGLTFTPGAWIESMQLSKGTGSVVNGFESVAGQINVEWKKPFEDKEPRLLLNVYQSTQGRSEANAVYRKIYSSHLSTNLLLHGKANWARVDQNKDGFLDQPLEQVVTAANRWFWFAPAGWEAQGGVKHASVNNLGGAYGVENNTDFSPGNPWGYQQQVDRTQAWAKLGRVFPGRPGRSMGLQWSAVHHQQRAQFGDREYAGTQRSIYSNFIYQTILGNTDHVLKAGISLQADAFNESWAGLAYKRREIVPGAFVEYSLTGSKRWSVIAGIRGDYHNLFGGFATPRLHVRYVPWQDAAIRASVGRAQRTANIFAENMGYMASSRSFFIQSNEQGGAYGLKPEVAWNTGLNLTQKFRLNYRDGVFTADYYATNFQNQVVVDIEDPHSVWFYNLNGRSFANSFQAQVDYELAHRLDLRAAYRYYDVKTTYQGTLKQRPLVAPHRAFLNIAYATRNRWSFDYTVQWIGEKRVPSAHGHHGPIEQGYYSPSFIQMNAQISKQWNQKKLEAYLGVENLTNYMQHNLILQPDNPYEAGFDASLVWGPAMGRNIYAGLRWKIK